MKRECVALVTIHAFDDVDLSIVWPVIAGRPECRPCPTAEGHVCHVQDVQRVGVICFRDEPHAHSVLIAGEDGGVVDSPSDMIRVTCEQSVLLCSVPINVATNWLVHFHRHRMDLPYFTVPLVASPDCHHISNLRSVYASARLLHCQS